ncbi:Na+/H+ antiporter NhaA [Homoserinibacter sp. GY 40078]|uniref:Na+/H+ antiporter NhaA n=1 Tax=Homoserinibacter sp. GY 40078 TaxID=2603275 RepID=UPI0011CA8850|nr:Na+/H+ antiporter NhaA [Homoserinibacter sp. GY 40078]TXK19041.1 Na+/H+ antiporter NhaA [Homoserinibacter sp. GY 40078]
MSLLRSERAAAAFLLTAAVLALVLANSPVGPGLLELRDVHLGIPGTPVDLSIGHWVSDGLLAVFFFLAAVELKNELTVGQLNSVAKAVRPAIAAVGGVIAPALIYLAVTAGSGYERGWPIPTATDIAFALGILAVFGSGIPSRLRIFILALAILDDIIAIVIIAVFFTSDPSIPLMLLAAVGVALFGLASRFLDGRWRVPVAIAMVILALVTWWLVYASGVHATIAGVALGLAMRRVPGLRVRHALEPVTNGFILPVFAFAAALVVIPDVGIDELAAPFWGIAIALPVGKMVGIGFGAWIASRIGPREARPNITLWGLLTAGALGGIGFTVSLLMNELAFASTPEVADEGTLAVLLGSGISIVVASLMVLRLGASYRGMRRLRARIREARY